MKIAITGATGHVGINLVNKLIELNYDVRVLIHKNKSAFNGLQVDKFEGDLLVVDSLAGFCKDVDIIFHLAALISIGSSSDNEVYETNVVGTKNLVSEAKQYGVKKIIHFSSIHALIHEPYDVPMDENREIAINSAIAYERTKAIAEDWVLSQQSNNLDVVIINPTSIIGPKDPGPSLMGEFMCLAYRGRIPGVVPGGYDWVDVRDIVNVCVEAMQKSKGGQRYILSGKWLSIKDFSDLFMKVSDKQKKLPVLPLWLAKIGIPFMDIFAKITNTKPIYTSESLSILQSGNKHISSKKAQQDLGFKNRPLEETLRDTFIWFKDNNHI